MSGKPKPAPVQVAEITTARELVDSMGAGSTRGGFVKLPYAVRHRWFRRDTPRGSLQLETVINAAHLQLLRMEAINVNNIPFYEVWFADLTTMVDGYDHTEIGDLLEEREVPSPVAAVCDPRGNRVYPPSYDTPFDERVEYEGQLRASAPAAQISRSKRPKGRSASIRRRDVQDPD